MTGNDHLGDRARVLSDQISQLKSTSPLIAAPALMRMLPDVSNMLVAMADEIAALRRDLDHLRPYADETLDG